MFTWPAGRDRSQLDRGAMWGLQRITLGHIVVVGPARIQLPCGQPVPPPDVNAFAIENADCPVTGWSHSGAISAMGTAK
jgi:hypothetical protein